MDVKPIIHKKKHHSKVMFRKGFNPSVYGGLYWTRTSDPIDVNDVLYQLSQQTVCTEKCLLIKAQQWRSVKNASADSGQLFHLPPPKIPGAVRLPPFLIRAAFLCPRQQATRG